VSCVILHGESLGGGARAEPSVLKATRQKLKEATFFYCHLAVEQSYIFRQQPEASEYYLSAFLSAGRSVTLWMEVEYSDEYKQWFQPWLASLSDRDRKLMAFHNLQRVQTVHKQGANVQNTKTEVPAYRLMMEMIHRGGRYDVWPGVPGTPPPTATHSVLWFVGDIEEPVTMASGEYLGVLCRMVDEFQKHLAAAA
jgi:hypothetical protein